MLEWGLSLAFITVMLTCGQDVGAHARIEILSIFLGLMLISHITWNRINKGGKGHE